MRTGGKKNNKEKKRRTKPRGEAGGDAEEGEAGSVSEGEGEVMEMPATDNRNECYENARAKTESARKEPVCSRLPVMGVARSREDGEEDREEGEATAPRAAFLLSLLGLLEDARAEERREESRIGDWLVCVCVTEDKILRECV